MKYPARVEYPGNMDEVLGKREVRKRMGSIDDMCPIYFVGRAVQQEVKVWNKSFNSLVTRADCLKAQHSKSKKRIEVLSLLAEVDDMIEKVYEWCEDMILEQTSGLEAMKFAEEAMPRKPYTKQRL